MLSSIPFRRFALVGLLVFCLAATATAGKPTKPGEGGGTTDPPPPPPVTYSATVYSGAYSIYFKSINASGTVVGYVAGPEVRPVILLANGDQVDLNQRVDPEVWELRSAEAINGSNQIVGIGYYNGQRVAYRYSPEVADPETGEVLSPETIEPVLPLRSGTTLDKHWIGGINDSGDTVMFTNVE